MTTMNVSLPQPLKEYVDLRLVDGGYSSASEYIRELIRLDQDRQVLRTKILEGLDSPVMGMEVSAFLDGLRSKLHDAR